jgi:hypothetical protein
MIDFKEELDRINRAYFALLGIDMKMPDGNTAALSRHETAQHILDRSPIPLPDFAYCREDVRAAGIPKEHQEAVMEVIQCFQMGNNGSHTELLKACAKLERSMFSVWKDEA